MELPGGTLIGRYVIVRKIGEGGMAEIYLAKHKGPEGFERHVAIKRIREFLVADKSLVDMFVTEARVAAQLVHPNIVPVFDFDRTENAYYIAMEYVHGKSLADVRHKVRESMKPLAPLMAVHIGHEVAKGLGYAHRFRNKVAPTGVVHRDVTPHNVLISYAGDVKLTDFGIAKVGSRCSTSGVLKGKFAYMSPEQARGEEVDVRTDVFALGIVLWEMLTGARLFQADGDVKLLKAVQESVIAPPSRLNPDVPQETSDAVMKALERDASLRYADGQEMAMALRRVLYADAGAAELDVAHCLRELFGEAAEATQQICTAPVPVKSGDTAPMKPAPASPDDDASADTVLRSDENRQGVPAATSSQPQRGAAPGVVLDTVRLADLGAAAVLPAHASVSFRGRRALVGAAMVLVAIAGGSVATWRLLRGRIAKSDIAAVASQPATPAPASNAPQAPVTEKPEAPAAPTSKSEPAALGIPAASPIAVKATKKTAERRTVAPAVAPARRAAGETAARPPPAGKGHVQIVVTPWARVYMDGAHVGEGPGLLAMPAGEHVVRLLNPESKIDWSANVRVIEGKRIEVGPGR